MTISRLAPWLAAALVTSCLVLWFSADAAPAVPGKVLSEPTAFAQLASVAAARGRSVTPGLATYVHFGDDVLAHAPLDGIAAYTDDEFQAGALIMAIVISSPRPGAVPNGSYVVKVQFEPGADSGLATYIDGSGREMASVQAYSRTPTDINPVFPGAYDPPPPPQIPNITSTHVWHNNHPAVDCAGWQPYHVIFYST
jgi:hypothetical protein